MNDNLPDIPGYEVQAEIGRGGMGIVYRACQRASGKLLAIKMILHGRGASLRDLARFRIEAEALACLDHPNIINIRDVGVYVGYPFIAIDYAERGSLKLAISGRPQEPRWAAELIRTLALALQHAHDRGMLHRDLKPSNVLLRKDGTPIVTDFGLVKFANPLRTVSEVYSTLSVSLLDTELARFARESDAQYRFRTDASADTEDELTRSFWDQCAARTGVLRDETRLLSIHEFLSTIRQQSNLATPILDGLTQAGSVLGSPSYMAPEQAASDLARIGPWTDVYGLGSILYELLTGQPPFRSESLPQLLVQVRSIAPVPPKQMISDVSGDLEAVCLKCLEKSPDARYPSARSLAEELSRFLIDTAVR